MGFIVVFALAAGMAVFAISVSLVALSLGLAVGAVKSGTSRALSRADLGLLILMTAVFYTLVYSFFDAQASGRESTWDLAILAYLVFILSAFALAATAWILRLYRRIRTAKSVAGPRELLGSALVGCLGFTLAYVAIASTGDFLLFKVKKSPPLELVVDGPPTHCVYATSGVRFYKISSTASEQLYRLEQGRKVHLNTSAFKAGEGWIRFAITDGDRRIVAYGLGSGIVALKNDGSCILPK